MKTILVTGSNGLLGQTLINQLANIPEIRLVATSKGDNRYPFTDGYEYAEMDICNKDQVADVVARFNPAVIINTAAMTNVDTCHTNREECWRLNVTAVETLVQFSEEYNIHLIHLSTDFVFDGTSGPYSEEDAPMPVSFYGESKLAAERLIQKSSCQWAILRTILVYGVTANMSRSNIVLWVKSALEKGEAIKVVNDQYRMPTLVQDLAAACQLVVSKQATGIYHISGKEMLSVYEIAMQVAEFWNLDENFIQPISSDSLNQEAKRPLKTGFILDKAIKILGYHPHSFEQGLKVVDKALCSTSA